MPDLRKDPIVGRWVIISTARSRRPVDYKTFKNEDHHCPPVPVRTRLYKFHLTASRSI